MAKLLHQLLRRTIYRSKGNLYCLDDPYRVLAQTLAGRAVNGFIDAGASDGRVSRRLLELFPNAQAYLFEPNPRYRQALEQISRQDPRYHPLAVALSDESGELELHETAQPGLVSRFKPNDLLHTRYPEQSQIRRTVKVPVTTLDQWWEQAGRPEVQLIKSDIQAGELRMLRGAADMLAATVPAIYAEVCFNPLYEGGALYSDIDLFLRERGFMLYNLYAPRHDPRGSGMLLWAHALFMHREKLTL
ncbi:MAG: FkbM family methyltransferase [Phycisphaeraceae bacterium]